VSMSRLDVWSPFEEDGPGHRDDGVEWVSVSPDSGRVYVSGGSDGGTTGLDATVIAYASTGRLIWVRRYNGPANGDDSANGTAVSPDGSMLFVGPCSGSTQCRSVTMPMQSLDITNRSKHGDGSASTRTSGQGEPSATSSPLRTRPPPPASLPGRAGLPQAYTIRCFTRPIRLRCRIRA